ncbi:MAG: sodium:alanine symporter family protein [Magnetococcales bacterium]|nr:sodium:alanine symporter family protein [Magnetococcales bacterium]
MAFMDWLAAWIWNPFLSLIYLEIGFLLLVMTRAVSWRRSISMMKSLWWEKPSTDAPRDDRTISHRKAFIAALAASIGVGNLAGVGTAIHLGGPGALFWIWMSALFGASFRMCSTYLAIRHQPKDPSSPLFATPMAYMVKFISPRWPRVAPLLAGLILFQGLVSANLIQANSVSHAVTNELGFSALAVAMLLFGAVAIVVVGGIRSIVEFSVAFAPWMIIIYVIASLTILFLDLHATFDALVMVFRYAWSPYSFAGGVAGFTVMQAIQFGVSRGVFSHFSGMGVAPFLQSANTDHPAKGAYMAALAPLVDGLLVCTMTGLVILSKGHWPDLTGAYLTVISFQDGLGGVGRVVVMLSLGLFAYTTIISWAHFSERCYVYLGGKNTRAYRWFFAGITFCGPFFPVAFIWSMADVVIGLMLIVHLVPLTYIVLRTRPSMMRALESDDLIPPPPRYIRPMDPH